MTYLAELAGNALTARQKDQEAGECFGKKENNVFKCLGFLSVIFSNVNSCKYSNWSAVF